MSGDEAISVPQPSVYDRRGIPIMPGDLLRSIHFKDYRRRWHYLYHVVNDEMVAVPLAQALGGRANGGDVPLARCPEFAAACDVVAETRRFAAMPLGGFLFRERKKVKP